MSRRPEGPHNVAAPRGLDNSLSPSTLATRPHQSPNASWLVANVHRSNSSLSGSPLRGRSGLNEESSTLQCRSVCGGTCRPPNPLEQG